MKSSIPLPHFHLRQNNCTGISSRFDNTHFRSNAQCAYECTLDCVDFNLENVAQYVS